MIRPFTLLCFCAFAGAGAWLYQVKHAVAVKDRELTEIRRQTEQARQRIDILRAEWALLNEPERLRQTATRVLSLQPMQPQHFVRASDFERRLPAPVAFAGAPDLFAPPPGAAPPAAG
ncbi:cell division protein FtsL, partial [Falsiroseomonas oryzae]